MRRWTLRVLCWLALGAVVNVAVAWQVSRGNWPMSLTLVKNEGWPIPSLAASDWPRPLITDRWQGLWMSRDISLSFDAQHQVSYSMTVEMIGWPCRSMRRTWAAAGGAATFHEEAPVPPPLNKWFGPHERFPVHILWSGFAIDTLFYALPVALLWLAPGLGLRWHRARNHLCIHCAYPIADPAKPCPECGKLVSSPAPAAR